MERLRTPDAPTGSAAFKQVLITIPTHVDLERFIWGALFSISFWTSWVEEGSLSVEDTIQLVKQVLLSRKEFNLIGAIVPFYTEELPNLTLLCDGSVYNKVDYPLLWEVLPAAAKDATTFTVPDLREKFLLGASEDYPVSQEGGEFAVTLTEAEMPSHTHTNTPHSHSESVAFASVNEISPGVPTPSAVPAAGFTGLQSVAIDSTGGGEAHENMPPYYAIRFYIVAGI